MVRDEISLMQRKRGRSHSPRRRRRERANREAERHRQERRSMWTVGGSRSRVHTETCSRRPLVAPWQKDASASRPSAAPTSSTTATGSHSVPDLPRLGNGSANLVWWSELIGINDPMEENDRVLNNQTVDAVVDNLRSMSPNRRAAMVAQIVPFLGAFLAELLRAINLAQLPAVPGEGETDIIEDDENALLQAPLLYLENVDHDDGVVLMQNSDPRIPFGSKLSQLQAYLNGFDATQCAQVVTHLQIMVRRLRQLAGETSAQITDRFQRLEALLTSYLTEEVEVPLSLQVWSESQLRVLIPYLNNGRTPECLTTVEPSAAHAGVEKGEGANLGSWDVSVTGPEYGGCLNS